MTDKPDFIVSGDQARLFPILAETSKEKRVASIFLAVMTQIPALADEVLGSVGIRVGKRTKIKAFTEVVLANKIENGCRPDGLIVVNTGKTTWSALIEAKIGKSCLGVEQVSKYLELAKANGIDAVITISNEFVARADHSPVTVPKTLLKKTSLYHWAWPWLATACEIISYQGLVEDAEQSYLLDQLNHFLAHPATGIERMTEMSASWKDVAQSIANSEALKKNSPEVESAVASWIAEERDLCLHLSSHVGRQVEARVERKLAEDPVTRLKAQVSHLAETSSLRMTMRVPDCASDIEICADMARRTVSASMLLKAPADRKSTKARVNWVLRMLPEDHDALLLRAHWPGRAAPTTKDVRALREDPALLQAENPDLVPHSFEVIYVEGLGKRYSGRRTFVEDLERIVKGFYDLVAANLKSWHAAPPKPVKHRDAPSPGELEMGDLEEGGAIPENATPVID